MTDKRNLIIDVSGSMTPEQIERSITKANEIRTEMDRVFVQSLEIKEVDPATITAEQIGEFSGMRGGFDSSLSAFLLRPRILFTDGLLMDEDQKLFDRIVLVPDCLENSEKMSTEQQNNLRRMIAFGIFAGGSFFCFWNLPPNNFAVGSFLCGIFVITLGYFALNLVEFIRGLK